MAGPLEGIRVIEVANYLAAPASAALARVAARAGLSTLIVDFTALGFGSLALSVPAVTAGRRRRWPRIVRRGCFSCL